MKYRKKVLAKSKKPRIEHLQGGILVRWAFREVSFKTDEGTETQWQYKEMLLPKKISKDKLKYFLQREGEYDRQAEMVSGQQFDIQESKSVSLDSKTSFEKDKQEIISEFDKITKNKVAI
jgi:hypothetical protein